MIANMPFSKLLHSVFWMLLLIGAAHAQTPSPLSAVERAISHNVTVKGSPAEIYQLFTTKEGVTSFFAPDAVVEPRVDGLFEMHINPYAPAGEKGGDGMRFLALQENKMLTFTWNAPPSLPEARKQRTVVILRFIEKSSTETEVRLHHTGWGDGGEWDKTFEYLSRAWPAVLGNLKKRAETGPIDWKPWLEQLRPRPKPEGGVSK